MQRATSQSEFFREEALCHLVAFLLKSKILPKNDFMKKGYLSEAILKFSGLLQSEQENVMTGAWHFLFNSFIFDNSRVKEIKRVKNRYIKYLIERDCSSLLKIGALISSESFGGY